MDGKLVTILIGQLGVCQGAPKNPFGTQCVHHVNSFPGVATAKYCRLSDFKQHTFIFSQFWCFQVQNGNRVFLPWRFWLESFLVSSSVCCWLLIPTVPGLPLCPSTFCLVYPWQSPWGSLFSHSIFLCKNTSHVGLVVLSWPQCNSVASGKMQFLNMVTFQINSHHSQAVISFWETQFRPN